MFTKILYPSEARTASPTPLEVENPFHRGAQVIIDVTAVTLTPSVTFSVQGKDPASGKWYELLASAAITSVSTVVLTIMPGAAATANVSANNGIPINWRVVATHADADSITYSVGVNMLR